MNELERRFGWRLKNIIILIRKEYYNEAFYEYSKLIKLFNCLHGYEDEERIEFYNKIKSVGDDFLLKLAKKKILECVNEPKTSKEEFYKRLKELTNKNNNYEIFELIKKEQFEKALNKHYENK